MRRCDQVLLIENGRLSSTGSFETISKSQSRFALSLRNFSASSIDFAEPISAENSQEVSEAEETRISLSKRKTATTSKLDELVKSTAAAAHQEQLAHGSISLKTYRDYFKSGANYLTLFAILLLMIVGQASLISTDVWLSRWSSQNSQEQHKVYYLVVFISLGIFTLLISMIRAICFFLICLKSSQHLFQRMLRSVFYAPTYFFQENSQGRILKYIRTNKSFH